MGRPAEHWKDIPGYEDYYQVSNLGRVRSKDRAVDLGRCIQNRKGKIMKPSLDTSGYPGIKLHKNGKYKRFQVHTLVLLAFDRTPEDAEECRHLDGNKENNKLENLKWGTGAENWGDRINHGTYGQVTEEVVREIKFCHKEKSQIRIARIYGIDRSLVSKIRSGERWAYISNEGVELTDARKKYIKFGHENMTQAEIARMYGIHQGFVSKIRAGHYWPYIKQGD